MRKLLSFSSLLTLLFSGCVNPANTKNKDQVVEVMAKQIADKYPAVANMEPLELVKLQKSGEKIVLVDVREKREIEISTIKGAVTQVEFEKNREKYKDYKIVPYCTIGLRSTQYVAELSSQGLKAYNLKGGILKWAHQGLSFVKDKTETKRAHVYDEPWNLLPEGYEAVTE